jgi:hypothetical protein
LAPVHENFGWAQLSAPAISLIILAAWAAMRQRELACGVLLALSTALKPQLGGVFFLYYIFTLGRRFGYGFVAVLGLLSAIALVRMEIHGTSWLSGWLENMRLAEAPGGPNSTSTENPDRSYLLHLQIILHGLFESHWVVNALAALITVALAAAFVWIRRGMPNRDELLCVSAVSILTLLPVYHRFYDAALLVIPLAWSIANLRARPREAWPVLLVVATLVIPYAAVRRVADLLGTDLATASGAVWDLAIEPARVWILLVGYVCLLLAMRPRTPASARIPAPLVEPSLAST